MQPLQRAVLDYKRRHGLTYKQLKEVWGVSAHSLRKMGCGDRTSIGVKAALRIEKVTNGEISAAILILGTQGRRGRARASRPAKADSR